MIIDESGSTSPTSGNRLGLFIVLGTDARPESWIVVDGLRIINSNWVGSESFDFPLESMPEGELNNHLEESKAAITGA